MTSVTREIYDLTKLMTLQYIKDRYKKMSGSKTVLLKYFFNRFISSVDINTLSTYQIEHIFSWDFQIVTNMVLYVLPSFISNLIDKQPPEVFCKKSCS